MVNVPASTKTFGSHEWFRYNVGCPSICSSTPTWIDVAVGVTTRVTSFPRERTTDPAGMSRCTRSAFPYRG